MRIGGGVRPNRSRVRHVRTEHPQRRAASAAVSRSGESLLLVTIVGSCRPTAGLLDDNHRDLLQHIGDCIGLEPGSLCPLSNQFDLLPLKHSFVLVANHFTIPRTRGSYRAGPLRPTSRVRVS